MAARTWSMAQPHRAEAALRWSLEASVVAGPRWGGLHVKGRSAAWLVMVRGDAA